MAAMELNKYSQILYEIENEWGYVPDYKCLVQHFSVAKMRRFKRFFDWLIESCMVQVEQSVKDDDSQRNQTRKIIDSANIGPKMSMVILNYFKNLTNPKRKRRLSLRTVRLYLRSATSLAIHCRAKGDIIPEQSDLNSFLSTKPGHQASLHPFITYLRAEGIAALSVQRQPATSINKNNRDKLKKSLFKVIHAAHEGEFTNGRLWNTLALQYFHGVSKKDSYRILKQGKYASDDNGVIYMFMDKGMWIPNITYCLDLV